MLEDTPTARLVELRGGGTEQNEFASSNALGATRIQRIFLSRADGPYRLPIACTPMQHAVCPSRPDQRRQP